MLIPPDVEAAVVALLKAGLHDNVATRVHNPTSARYVRVTATGGSPTNLVQGQSRILVECWAADETSAFSDAATAWGLLSDAQHSFIAAGTWVADIGSSMPVNFPDPDTKSPRYQFVATLRTSFQEATA